MTSSRHHAASNSEPTLDDSASGISETGPDATTGSDTVLDREPVATTGTGGTTAARTAEPETADLQTAELRTAEPGTADTAAPETAEPAADETTDRENRLDRAGRVFPAANGRVLLEALIVAVLASAFGAVLYRLWTAPLHLPVAYLDRDLNQTQMTVKTIVQHGWILHQSHLGAPYGQVNYDFPQGGEALQYVVIRFLALFTSSTGLIINAYYFLGFGALAATTFLVLRHLRFGPLVSAAVALPYAFLPLHLYQNEAHMTRTAYLSVPLGALLLVWLNGWRERFLIDPTRPVWRGNLRWRRVLAALAICLIVGSWETMATAFTLLLLASTALLGAIRWHDWRRLVVGAIGLAGVGISFGLVSFPSLWYWHTHGKNLVAGKRIVAEAELYGLKINAMVLPSGGGRLHFMQVLAAKSQAQTPVPSEGGQGLNLLFTLGFLGALYAAVAGVRRARTAGVFDWRPGANRDSLRELIGMNTIVAVVVGTVGGFSTVLALMGFGQVRTWDRIVLYIAFFALLQVAIWFERFAAWARVRFGRFSLTRPVLAVAVAIVTMLALADGPRVSHPPFADIISQWNNDTATVDAIERRMPAGSNIMQLPVLAYPEVYPPGKMLDYDPLRPFLADEKGALNWSYAGVKGRPEADWQQKVADGKAVVADLPALLGMGFTGLWVDTFGYTKDLTTPAKIAQALGEQPIVSPDGRFQFFDLRPYKAKLGQSDAQLRQLATKTFGIAPPS